MSTFARVTLTLEITAHSSWNNSTQMDQIFKQAKEDVLGQLSRLFEKEHEKFRVIGDPIVTAVMASSEKGPAR